VPHDPNVVTIIGLEEQEEESSMLAWCRAARDPRGCSASWTRTARGRIQAERSEKSALY